MTHTPNNGEVVKRHGDRVAVRQHNGKLRWYRYETARSAGTNWVRCAGPESHARDEDKA